MTTKTCLTIICLCAFAGSAFAAQATVDEGLPGTCDQMNWVALDGKVIMRIRTPGQEESCLSRKWIIQDRITQALSEPVGPADVRVAYRNGVPGVFVGNSLIVTADEHDARANDTSAISLAHTWARNLSRTLLPSLPWSHYQAYLDSHGGSPNRYMARSRDSRGTGMGTMAIDR